MYKNKTITLYLPARNEEKTLRTIQIPQCIDEVIVINNCSTDSTKSIAEKRGFKVIDEPRVDEGGIGYGFAHMTGITEAKGDVIVTADCDATYPIEIVTDLVDELLASNLDFISCSRYPAGRKSGIPLSLRFGVWFLGVETRILYGIKITDILSGMWLMRSDIKDVLGLTMGDWNLSPQIKINAATNPDINFGEFKIEQKTRIGTSHQHYFSTGFSHLRWLLANRLSSLRTKKNEYFEVEDAAFTPED